MGQLNHEPSMEDILASIKRIIAEDSEAAGAKTPKARSEAMVAASSSLSVHEAPEPGEEVAAAPAPAEPAHAEIDDVEADAVASPAAEAGEPDLPDVLELTSPMPEADTIPAAKPALAAKPVPGASEGLVSSPAAQASRNAFAALGQLQVRVEEGAPNTLDGLVADLLKPMLSEWLDRELPAMVERLVSAEVARLSGRN